MTKSRSASDWTTRFGPIGALVAGGVWLLIWAHQALAHGTTSVNEMRVVYGLTWMDSGKFLVVPFLLLIVTMVGLDRRRSRDHMTRSGLMVVASLVLLVVGTAIEFWGFPRGSYDLTFEGRFDGWWWPQFLATIVLTVALVPFGVQLARADALPAWTVPMLVIGAATTIFLTPTMHYPGVVWALLGLTLVRSRGSHGPSGCPDNAAGAA